MNPLILSIDTSCDETAVAVLYGRRVLSNVVWSQIEIHKPWGGVVPSLAKREHAAHIDNVVATAIKRADTQAKRASLGKCVSLKEINAVAVTYGPGLAIALEVGIMKAKEIALKYGKLLIAVNHMEGHLLSFLAQNSAGRGNFSSSVIPSAHTVIPSAVEGSFVNRISEDLSAPLRFARDDNVIQFPYLGLLVSGGHTEFVLVKNIGEYEVVGKTLDDAAGEAFDKVAKMLDLGYPGGPIVSSLAEKGAPRAFDLPVPMIKQGGLDFSFSGLKTACLYKIKETPKEKRDKKFIQDFCASFERVLIESIIFKLKLAIDKYQPKMIALGGGVINNEPLRRAIRKTAAKRGVKVYMPHSDLLFSDNAGMIGIAAYYKFLRGEFVENINSLDRDPSLTF